MELEKPLLPVTLADMENHHKVPIPVIAKKKMSSTARLMSQLVRHLRKAHLVKNNALNFCNTRDNFIREGFMW